MGLGALILAAVISGLAIAAVLVIGYLTVKKLKELIQERKEKNEKSRVAFGETKKIIKENAKEIIENSSAMTMEDLEKVSEETPYFVVDYDPLTDEVSDYTTIKPEEGVDEKIDNMMNQSDGIIVFE